MQRTLTVLLLFSIMLMASIAAASAQASDHYDVYAVGFCSKGQGYRVTGYWKNREWHALPNPLVCGKPDAFLIAVSGKDVYAAGSCGTSGLGYWKNDSWNWLPPPRDAKSAEIKCLAVSGADVYVGGNYKNAAGVSAPGYWKNGTWHGLSPLDPNKEALASCIAVEGVDVYVGGRCKTASGTFFGYWKNGFWRELMNTRQDLEYGTVIRLAVSGTDVEAAVWFKFSYHPRGDIRGWRNDAWKSLGSFDKEEGERIRATVVFGRDVYVPFNLSDSKTFSPCYLKNRDKVPLEIPDPATDGWVYSMTVVGK